MAVEVSGPTAQLARYAAGIRYDDLPDDVVEMARRCLLDWLGIAIAGSRQPLSPVLRATVEQVGGNPQASVIGWGLRTSVPQAALVNATFAHSIDFDDVHLASGVHASAPVWAAALAVGEWRDATPTDITAAFVAGYEVMARLGRAVGKPMIQAHHHPTGVLGYFGAAAAAGRLLGLDEAAIARAFGIAAGQAGALIAVRGTMSKPYFAGHAAQGGVQSALLAANGFDSTTDVIENPEGVLATFGARPGGRAFDGLGERYELLKNAFKAYAACAMTHPMLDGLLDIRQEANFDADAIEEIVIGSYPYATEYVNRPTVATGLAGKFSAQYCAAVAILDGQAQEPQFTDARAADPRLRAIAGRVRLAPVEEFGIDQAEVAVRLRGGPTFRRRIEQVSGSPERPMTWTDLVAKFAGLTGVALPAERVTELSKRIGAWPDTDLASLLALTTG